MKCDWHEFEPPDENGRRRVTCTRCGYVSKTKTDFPLEQIHSVRCLALPRWDEPGNWLEFYLTFYGLSQQRWAWLMQRLGWKCGCQDRQSAMNRWGARFAAWFKR